MARFVLLSASVTFEIALVVAMATGRAAAHVGDMVYPIYELPTADLPDLGDGTLEDWDEVLPFASLTHNDFTVEQAIDGQGIDPGDLAWRIFLAWNYTSQRIYFAVERLDDIYLQPGEGPIGEGGTYFFIDGDHSGGQFEFYGDPYTEEEQKRLTGAQAQTYVVKPEPPPGSDNLVRLFSWASDWAARPPWAEVGGYHDEGVPAYSIVEGSFTAWDDLDYTGPETSRRSSLQPDGIVGIMVWVWDMDDDTGTFESFILAKPSVQSRGQWADNFVDSQLIPCTVGDCSRTRRTAVDPNSWGRIKAALR